MSTSLNKILIDLWFAKLTDCTLDQQRDAYQASLTGL